MSNTLILFIIGGVLFLVAGAMEIMLVVQGFKVSRGRGLLAAAAPLLLGLGLGALFFASHLMAMAQVGSQEAKEQGDREATEQIEELNKLEDLQLDL